MGERRRGEREEKKEGGGRKGRRKEFHPEKMEALAARTAQYTYIPFTIVKGERILKRSPVDCQKKISEQVNYGILLLV